jgi:hypothetical protein
MNYVPAFIPVLLILALMAVTLYRPSSAYEISFLPKASVVCDTQPCR